MPASKNALIRYKTIDRCLRNRYRRWTLDDLIEACSDALYEFEGKTDGVSRRTVQLDIQMMRSEKLGYSAPIKVVDNKYYIYEDPDYSITESPLAPGDIEKIEEAAKVLHQLSGFQHFAGMEDLVGRLQDRVSEVKDKVRPIIFLDKNDNLKGLSFITPLHTAISKKVAIEITYQSFKAVHANSFIFHPYALKEFNNRWFVIGRRADSDGIMNLALDRMVSFTECPEIDFVPQGDFDTETWYKNVIGVTRNDNDIIYAVRFRADASNSPYIRTKPMHSSQKTIEEHEDGSATFEINVVINRELIRLLLGYGSGLKVLSPKHLVKIIRKNLSAATSQYED